MEPFLQIAPHSLAIVLSRVVAEDAPGVTESEEPPQHHTGYEIFADFKSLNMKYFWNKMVADAIAETFFLGWIDEHVLLIQGKEDHLEVLREAWMRRSLKPPQGFDIKYLGKNPLLVHRLYDVYTTMRTSLVTSLAPGDLPSTKHHRITMVLNMAPG